MRHINFFGWGPKTGLFGVGGQKVYVEKVYVLFLSPMRISDACVTFTFWETDFSTTPVLGGAALLPFSAPAVYKKSGFLGHRIFIHRWR